MLVRFCLVIAVVLLSGCAIPIKGAEMTPKTSAYDGLSSKLDRKINVGDVTAAPNLGPTFTVLGPDYKEALIMATRMAGWYSTDPATYTLNANMSKLDQPSIGFTFTVKSTAHYTLINNKSGNVVFEDTLTLPCTVTFSEEFMGDLRLRRATGCSVGENITHLLKTLSDEKL